MIVLVIVVLIILGTGIYMYRKKKGIIGKSVDQVCNLKEGKFVIGGMKNRFIICKNNDIEFLIKNGQIVACKDKRVSNDFKFYGGGKNGIN